MRDPDNRPESNRSRYDSTLAHLRGEGDHGEVSAEIKQFADEHPPGTHVSIAGTIAQTIKTGTALVELVDGQRVLVEIQCIEKVDR